MYAQIGLGLELMLRSWKMLSVRIRWPGPGSWVKVQDRVWSLGVGGRLESGLGTS